MINHKKKIVLAVCCLSDASDCVVVVALCTLPSDQVSGTQKIRRRGIDPRKVGPERIQSSRAKWYLYREGADGYWNHPTRLAVYNSDPSSPK